MGWTYSGDFKADGEFVSFDSPGVPTYHLDSDPSTFAESSVPQHGDGLACGGGFRAVLCCYPVCAAP